MKKTVFIFYILCFLVAGCKLIDNERPGNGLYVRVVNTGSVATQGYIINEPYGHKLRQHFFPGLQPGDSAQYTRFKKLKENEPVTLIMDSVTLTHLCRDCDARMVVTKGRVTIYIKSETADLVGKKANNFEVSYYYGSGK